MNRDSRVIKQLEKLQNLITNLNSSWVSLGYMNAFQTMATGYRAQLFLMELQLWFVCFGLSAAHIVPNVQNSNNFGMPEQQQFTDYSKLVGPESSIRYTVGSEIAVFQMWHFQKWMAKTK